MHVAVVGCGQLARMMALAGWRLGVTFSFLAEPNEGTACVEHLGKVVVRDEQKTIAELYAALGHPEVMTVEREHVDVAMLKAFAEHCAVHPNPNAVSVSQHRGREKTCMRDLGIGTAPFTVASNAADLKQAVTTMGLPVLIKSCEEGYDGKGQWMIREAAQLDSFFAENNVSQDMIVEGLVNFSEEVSIIAVRSTNDECAFYPITENEHRNGILLTSIAPAKAISPALTERAEDIAQKILRKLDYVGVLSVELFIENGELLVNEIAPRVHNSGHWTQAAGISSQFENHIRAICGMPLGNTQPKTAVGMVNLLGVKVSDQLLDRGNLEIHHYNKAIRPGRKVGHINLWNIDREQLAADVTQLRDEIYSDES
ncbi:MAG: 5-(carboxyamino)imidazole ribonucleotide synthase [Gammaproteobacteria bacterium]|nr:5-(carboxyamino)imidazole ribonucleotide synthase [Gammaproteobacteria bacterium]NVK88573.1 5-(carboxyamino)imidazole ribonucleotide synthase [Gammaproteobacteria bacterium]